MNSSKNAIRSDAQLEARSSDIDAHRQAWKAGRSFCKVALATATRIAAKSDDRLAAADVTPTGHLIDDVADAFMAAIEAIGLECSRRLNGGVTRVVYAYPSRRMRSADAAYYLAVSEATFLARVKAGIYPPGQREVGVLLWLRDDLDAYIDRQFGVILSGPANDPIEQDPFVARCKGSA